jgi:hypothetical protein
VLFPFVLWPSRRLIQPRLPKLKNEAPPAVTKWTAPGGYNDHLKCCIS